MVIPAPPNVGRFYYLTGPTAICIMCIMKNYDVVIIGGGAAGLSAAAAAIARGQRVAVLDMGRTPARKVMASGGGRCNFTNMAADRDRYFGNNPDFVRSAICRVSPADILDWVTGHGLEYTEKAPGQYFCTGGAADIVRALMHDANGADIILNTTVLSAKRDADKFIVACENDNVISCDRLIVATGGISWGTLGVSDIGYKIAKEFGHKILPPRPALCAIDTNAFPHDWAGISMGVQIRVCARKVSGDMLFTHFGIGGPAVYSASIAPSDCDIHINLMPGIDVLEWLRDAKRTDGKKSLSTILAQRMPTQIARHFGGASRNIADIRDTELADITKRITDITIPSGTWRHHGMAGAEVTYGGIDTAQISSKTMESKIVPGLFFAGEVMDITGDLGGFNLQWAWASGRVAGMNA